MKKLYFPYHSLDPRQAIERILEENGMDMMDEEDAISKGVKILRKIKNKNNISK